MKLPPPDGTPYMPRQEELFRAFAERSDGHDRAAVIGAAGNLILNTLRQNNKTLGDAYEELDDLVARMKKVLAERHYSPDGSRQNHHIVIGPQVRKLFEAIGNA